MGEEETETNDTLAVFVLCHPGMALLAIAVLIMALSTVLMGITGAVIGDSGGWM